MITSTQRKHITQMAPTEMGLARRAVDAAMRRGLGWKEHALDRLAEKGLARDEAELTLRNGAVVEVERLEFDKGGVDVRVLLRLDRRDSGTCVVVSLPRCLVVTAWANRPDDQHATLDYGLYSRRAPISDWLAAFTGRSK